MERKDSEPEDQPTKKNASAATNDAEDPELEALLDGA